MNIDNFFLFSNKLYLKESIPEDQVSKNNFNDISNKNMDKLIDLLNNIDNNNSNNRLLKLIYNKYINFSNLLLEEQNNICNNIINNINNIIKKEELINKITDLHNIGINLFISYYISTNPFEGKPYIIHIKEYSLSLNKEYYFNSIYKNEYNELKKYRLDLLSRLKTKYNIFKDLDVKNICEDVEYMENYIAPYILSNECNNKLDDKLFKYKIKNIIKVFSNLNFDNDTFLDTYNLKNKLNTDIIFNNNIKTSKIYTKELNYLNLDKDTKYNFDNGEYYWYFIDNLFKRYKIDINFKKKVNNYIIWLIISNKSLLICDELRILHYNLYKNIFLGQKYEKSVERRAVLYLIETLPELIGELFCNTYFNFQHKQLMIQLVDYLLESTIDLFDKKCKWMDLTTKNECLLKIQKIMNINNKKIGFPNKSDYYIKYKLLKKIISKKFKDINCITLYDFENILIIWYEILNIIKLNYTKISMKTWNISAAETNAYFNPIKNEIVFPAGILQEPFFIYFNNIDIINGININNNKIYKNMFKDRLLLSKKIPSLLYITMASNFGSIGTIIGHEISHSFDKNGSLFDHKGKKKNWWSAHVYKTYNIIVDKIINQYNNYFIELNINNKKEKLYLNGKYNLDENIADLFGLLIAINAYKNYYNLNKQYKTLEEGLIELFVSFSNTWRHVSTDKYKKFNIINDSHSPPMFRVNGTLKNIEDFYKVFNINYNKNSIISIFE
jgi:putative endopeptidase